MTSAAGPVGTGLVAEMFIEMNVDSTGDVLRLVLLAPGIGLRKFEAAVHQAHGLAAALELQEFGGGDEGGVHAPIFTQAAPR